MQSGAYKHLITIEKREKIIDSIGNTKKQWIEFKKDYAYANGLSGQEYWEAQKSNDENTIDFTLRWKPYLDTIDTKEYRIVFKGKMYNIKTIDNIRFNNKNVKIRCTSENGKDNG